MCMLRMPKITVCFRNTLGVAYRPIHRHIFSSCNPGNKCQEWIKKLSLVPPQRIAMRKNNMIVQAMFDLSCISTLNQFSAVHPAYVGSSSNLEQYIRPMKGHIGSRTMASVEFEEGYGKHQGEPKRNKICVVALPAVFKLTSAVLIQLEAVAYPLQAASDLPPTLVAGQAERTRDLLAIPLRPLCYRPCDWGCWIVTS